MYQNYSYLPTKSTPQGIVCYTFQVNGRAVMSLPCVNGRKFASKLARLAVTEGLLKAKLYRKQSLSRLRRQLPLHKGACRCGGIAQS